MGISRPAERMADTDLEQPETPNEGGEEEEGRD